jgi:hypothetical protein
MNQPTGAPPVLPADRALAIAHADAVAVYHDLTPYRIQLALEADGWHIDYEVQDARRKGGGPHYVIDATNGQITSKRYEQ